MKRAISDEGHRCLLVVLDETGNTLTFGHSFTLSQMSPDDWQALKELVGAGLEAACRTHPEVERDL